MSKKGGKQNGPDSVAFVSARYSGFGLQFAFATLLFLLLGMWLDGKLGTTPWLMILGAFVGAGAGFYSLYFHLVIRPRLESEEGQET